MVAQPLVDSGDTWHDNGFGTQHIQWGVNESTPSDVIDVDKGNYSSDLDFVTTYDMEDSEEGSVVDPAEYGYLTYQSVKANCKEMC